ncbi:MAG: hypothetical protein HDT21_01350 [Ruminococcus sp.]|nr:hypothetical protein [Ruminococcus sp.]
MGERIFPSAYAPPLCSFLRYGDAPKTTEILNAFLVIMTAGNSVTVL